MVAGPHDGCTRLYRIQSDATVPRGDPDRTATCAAARLDHHVGIEHSPYTERVDGAHGVRNFAVEPDAVFS